MSIVPFNPDAPPKMTAAAASASTPNQSPGTGPNPQSTFSKSQQQAPDNADTASTASAAMAEPDIPANNRYLFVAKDMPKEMKSRLPEAEVSIVKSIADAFTIKKGSQVLLAPVRLTSCPLFARPSTHETPPLFAMQQCSIILLTIPNI